MNKIQNNYFIIAKQIHLRNLDEIREFILGIGYNEPQITYVPEMIKFDELISRIREYIEESYTDIGPVEIDRYEYNDPRTVAECEQLIEKDYKIVYDIDGSPIDIDLVE